MTKLARNQREQETLYNELFLSNQTDSENGFLVNRLTVDCSRQRGRVVGLAPPTKYSPLESNTSSKRKMEELGQIEKKYDLLT